MNVRVELTPASLETFKMYAKDAPNWDGNPWVSQGNISPTKEQRGNLADLSKKGLIVIHDYEGRGNSKDMYIEFTYLGMELAREVGHPIEA